MRILTALLFLLSLSATTAVYSQSFNSFRTHVLGLTDGAAQTAAIDSFMAATTFPYTNGDTAHFIYRGSAGVVQLAGDFNFWDPTTLNLNQLGTTDLYWTDLNFELNARMDYKFVIDGSWILDPLHTNTVSGGFGPNSELAMPNYVQPWEIQSYPTVPTGTIETDALTSDYGTGTHSLQIYLPPGYDPMRSKGYPVAYFQDGQEYVALANAANIFDNLIDSGLIEPTIGVFVRPNDRNDEYAFDDRNAYRQFFIDQLVPWVDATYNSENHPGLRAVIGASFGGNISGQIAFNHPEIFGNCGLHSGAFWPNSNETYSLFTSASPIAVRIASIWGTYEGGLTTNMQDFKDDVAAAGNALVWDEWPEGHSWGLWRASLDEMLKFFFPPGVTGLETPELLTAVSLFPNPATSREQVTIGGHSFFPLEASIALYDIYGRQIQAEQQWVEGNFQLSISLPELAAGNYFIQLRDTDNQQVLAVRKLTID